MFTSALYNIYLLFYIINVICYGPSGEQELVLFLLGDTFWSEIFQMPSQERLPRVIHHWQACEKSHFIRLKIYLLELVLWRMDMRVWWTYGKLEIYLGIEEDKLVLYSQWRIFGLVERRLWEDIIALLKLFKYLLGYCSWEKLHLFHVVPKGKTKANKCLKLQGDICQFCMR